MSALHCLRAIKQVFTLNCCCHLCCQAHRHNPQFGIIAITSIIAIVIFVIMIVIFIITMVIFIIMIVTRYQRLWSSGPSREILHCTSCYLGRNQGQQAKKYLEEEEEEEEGKGEQREKVQNASARAAGRVFPLKVVSLFLTSRTWGAAVDLSKEQRDLWLEGRKSPSSSIPAKLQSSKPAKSSSGRTPHGVKKKQKEEEVDLEGGFEACQPTMRVQSQTATEEEEQRRRRRRNTTTGRRAHITLGRAEGVRPVQAGVDLEDILDELELAKEDCGTDVEGGRLYLLSGKAVFLELKQPITFTSLFTGSY